MKNIRGRWMALGAVACLVLVAGCGKKAESVAMVDGQVVSAGQGVSEKELAAKQKTDEAAQAIRVLESAVDRYEMDVGKLPDSLRDLVGSSAKGWEGPYIRREEGLKDPWGNDFQYTKTGTQYKIVSGGPDGIVGNEDDVK